MFRTREKCGATVKIVIRYGYARSETHFTKVLGPLASLASRHFENVFRFALYSMFYVVGLGNPGAEYEKTRHNTGRNAVEALRSALDFPSWEEKTKLRALLSVGEIGKNKTTLILPNTFMNKSGETIKLLVKSVKQAEQLVVVHDDLDLPFGKFKISFNKSSGGHKGVESIVKAIKTQAFIRVRVGISPFSAKASKGKQAIILKKPKGEAEVERHILGAFKPAELTELKQLHKKICEAITAIVSSGREKAMSGFN